MKILKTTNDCFDYPGFFVFPYKAEYCSFTLPGKTVLAQVMGVWVRHCLEGVIARELILLSLPAALGELAGAMLESSFCWY